MPVSVVVGGQFGSEGKGKVALHLAEHHKAAAVVRVGGTNSGHTAVDHEGKTRRLRQLPAAALAEEPAIIMPAGSLIDIEIFRREVRELHLGPDRVKLDPDATVISPADIEAERNAGLRSTIGSTGSGTGAALQRRISRAGSRVLASDHAELRPFLAETKPLMRRILNDGRWIVIEGTQGFGLSILHGGFYPKATSRDTTAASFVGEAGLSPLDVEEVALVIRTFPIRVAGDSGPLKNETSWDRIAEQAGLPSDYCELTTVTSKVRRVAGFDVEIVQKAIEVNNPNVIVLNHLDYVDGAARNLEFTSRACSFVERIERELGINISLVGTDPATLVPRSGVRPVSSARQSRSGPASQIAAFL